ncbi:hypothetical protein [Marinomonas posidonica]|uniref:Uncharacterized protein n=1 Tax=Marinomonas posidonica (strain CECT 7376 / NCIMB 14433 / IVIA-Po-181) TaxID=491952 RepID=F6CVB1_MARPP|nr:hypothetical protein [Marinomonas posidonica]AEF54221.1 hypothetical protein Mar181_1174 [Marinomonas posidonica IVIA-Po-181]
MPLPNTIFVAIGVITAASLTGVFSFITLINQKEGKVSEFRQNWIDALRKDIAKLTSCLDRISTSWQLIKLREDKKEVPFDGLVWMDDLNELVKDDVSNFSECHNRILLSLNPEDDKELISKLKIAKLSLSNSEVLFEKAEIDTQIENIVYLTQQLLKTEWEVVKSGEKAYINTKRATTFIVATLLLTLPVTYFYFLN